MHCITIAFVRLLVGVYFVIALKNAAKSAFFHTQTRATQTEKRTKL